VTPHSPKGALTAYSPKRALSHRAATASDGFGPGQQRCNTAPSVADWRPRASVNRTMEWIEQELDLQGLDGTQPSVERVRIFSNALVEVIEMLPSYRPFLLSLQREYDGLVNRLQSDLLNLAPLEGRLKTLKAESFSFVGQSMTWFQMEIACLKQKLEETEKERDGLRQENEALKEENKRLGECSEKDKYQASESHLQNLDILQYLDRMEKTVEGLRKQERELNAENKAMEKNLKHKDDRMQAAEKQLEAERKKIDTMISMEDHEAVREEVRHLTEKEVALHEQITAKEKDYLRIVEIYQNSIGQDGSKGPTDPARPLTPRPTWVHCRGMLDPDVSRSIDKAEHAQDLLQHVVVKSRSVLAAYGLMASAQKSALLADMTRNKFVLPLVSIEREKGKRLGTKEAGSDDGRTSSTAESADKDTKAMMLEEEATLSPDEDLDTPELLRHSERVKNLRLSRRKALEFLDHIVQVRSRSGSSVLNRPYIQVMMEHPMDMSEEERFEFLINVFVTVRRYSQEPDFLAYLLLITGKLADSVVKDNKGLCGEILRIIMSAHDGKPQDAKTCSKQDFFFGLKDLLPHKDQEKRNQLAVCLPSGQADVMLNLDWLLTDDAYVLSPIVYVLRLQHLQESVELVERLTEHLAKCKRATAEVRYEDVQAACRGHAEFGLLEPEDFAKGFEVKEEDLEPDTQQEVPKLAQLLMLHTDLFNALLFPRCDPEGAGVQ